MTQHNKQSRPCEHIPFGRSIADGRMYEPRQVPLGKKCGCICPACSNILYARHCLSGKRAPHFAHAPGSACESGTETSLHLAAKQIIEEHKAFFFPELTALVEVTDAFKVVHRASSTVASAGSRQLSTVVLEQAVGSTRPDVLVEADELGTVAIEIAVTHFADQEKVAKLRALELSAVEVDLSGMWSATFDDLRSRLLGSTVGKLWLYHPRSEAAQVALRQSLEPVLAGQRALRLNAFAVQQAAREAAAKDRQLAHAQKLARERAQRAREQAEREERLREREEQQRKTVVFKAAPELEKREIMRRWLGRADLSPSLKMDTSVRGAFRMSDPHVWQTALFVGLIHKRPARGMYALTVETALRWMGERFSLRYTYDDSDEFALREYLHAMVRTGALFAHHRAYFQIGVADLTAFETLRHLQEGKQLPTRDLAERVRWADEEQWPSLNQPTVMALVMGREMSLRGGWYKLSTLDMSARNTTPYRICQWGAEQGIDEAKTFEYLVRTGYVRLID